MKKMKLFVLALGAMVLLAGCGSLDESGNGGGYDTGDAELDEALAAVDVYDPTNFVELGQYKGVPVNVYVSDEDVEEEIKSILKSNTTTEQIDTGKVKDGDTVNIKFVGKMNGEEFPGGTSESYDLTIGSNQFIKGFETGLIGVEVGSTVSLDLTFPDPYKTNPDYSGKPVVFEVTVNYIKGDDIIPEFNDDFVKEYTKDEYKTTDDYKKHIVEEMTEQKRSQAGDTAYSTVLSTSKVTDCPDYLVNIMKLRLDATNKAMAASRGYDDFSKFITEVMNYTEDQYNEELLAMAQAYAEEKLIAEAIAKIENIEVTQDEYNEQLNQALQSSKFSSEEELDKYMVSNYRSRAEDMISESVLMQKVIQFVKDNSVEVTTPPDEDAGGNGEDTENE